MPVYNLNDAKTHLSSLLEAVQKGEEIIIARYGVPIAKLTAIKKPEKRKLGFYPIQFKSDLLEPTDSEILESFYQ
jgi:prevent-host-death family protein